ncbi:MAG: LPS export ABC transporter periplasmic protein LptC [Micavibrio sp.]|nr:LPS export ABC transporter periplasmic protein LptC [Micavibrio sp.]
MDEDIPNYDDPIHNSQPKAEQGSPRADRLQSLSLGQDRVRHQNHGYSVLIKSLKIFLPMLALGLLLVVITWQRVEDVTPKQDESAQEESQSARSIGKNELLNPKFESTDEDGNPYTVTAKRALQGQSADDDMILLEEPVADIALEDGNWLAVKAEQSAFAQTTQRLLLKGAVEIYHDEGYTLTTPELDVDMKAGTARTDTKVHIQGPKGVLDAEGLDANRGEEVLIFKGPAKLILTEGM